MRSGHSGLDRVGVIVADDHPLYRDGLVRVLRERGEIDVLAQAEDGRKALECIRQLRPHVAVLDLALPDIGLFCRSRGSLVVIV